MTSERHRNVLQTSSTPGIVYKETLIVFVENVILDAQWPTRLKAKAKMASATELSLPALLESRASFQAHNLKDKRC